MIVNVSFCHSYTYRWELAVLRAIEVIWNIYDDLDAENNIIDVCQNAFGRNPTEVELESDLGRLNEGDLSYGWLGVEMVTSDEAGTTFDGVLAFYDWV